MNKNLIQDSFRMLGIIAVVAIVILLLHSCSDEPPTSPVQSADLIITVIYPTTYHTMTLEVTQDDRQIFQLQHAFTKFSMSHPICTTISIPYDETRLINNRYMSTVLISDSVNTINTDCMVWYQDWAYTELRCEGVIQSGDTIRF